MAVNYRFSCHTISRTYQLTADEMDAVEELDGCKGDEFLCLGGFGGRAAQLEKAIFLHSVAAFKELVSIQQNRPVHYFLEYELYPGYIVRDAGSATGLRVGGKIANIEANTTCKLFTAASIDSKGRATWDNGMDISNLDSITTDSGKVIRITRNQVSLQPLIKFLDCFSELIRERADSSALVEISYD